MATEPGQRLALDASAAVAGWSRDAVADKVQIAAQERESFVQLFPPTVWPDLPLERYALGLPQSDEGFSRWLEFATPNTGSIKGGSAHKHLVYKRQPPQTGWYFPKRYASEIEAWDAIHHGFAELVRLAGEGQWDQVDEIQAIWDAPSVRTKTAWMYFPDQLLPIYSKRNIDFFIEIFDVTVTAEGTTHRNRALFEALIASDLFSGWSPIEIMYFLYDWADPNPGHTIVKIAPGEGAALWDDCVANGYIRVAWDEIGDLTLLQDVDEIRQALIDREGMGDSSSLTRTARALELLRSLEDGDIVLANRGLKTVVGIGTVNGGYQYRPDLTDHRHTVGVTWSDTNERPVDAGSGWRTTIARVKPEQYHRIIREDAIPVESTPGPVPVPDIPTVHRQTDRLLKRSKQVILYGPPGTGKTFSARRHAVWMLAGGVGGGAAAAQAFGTQMSALEARYSTRSRSSADVRPSWLLVANPQQWQWSRLVTEGFVDYRYGKIQSNYPEVRPGDVVYGYEATPTKAVVARARITQGLHKSAEGEQKILVGQGELIDSGPSWANLQDDPVLAASEPVRHGMQGTLFRLEPTEAAHLQTMINGGAADGDGDSTEDRVPQLTRVTFHPTYTYEDFIEGYKPVESGSSGGLELRMRDGIFKRLCKAAAGDPENDYILLIDEINRGNVPKIFGELITLLEADKRGVTVTLPQSGDDFMVPENLYLIGTMNTADRSIHVLDAALRRRFAFVELLPDPTQLEGTSVGRLPLDELLEQLNALVREHIGREKQIGHAVLMNGGEPITSAEDLVLAFRYEILPLLQEYTFGDYSDLAALVGPDIIDAAAEVPRADVVDDPEQLISALVSHLNIDRS